MPTVITKPRSEPEPHPLPTLILAFPVSSSYDMALTPRSFSHPHNTPNPTSLVIPKNLLRSNSGSSPSPLSSPSPSSTSFRSQRSDSGSSSTSRRHKTRGIQDEVHTNIYTNCGRHSDEWLFGGLSWWDIWWWIWGWMPFPTLNGSGNQNRSGEEVCDYLVREGHREDN